MTSKPATDSIDSRAKKRLGSAAVDLVAWLAGLAALIVFIVVVNAKSKADAEAHPYVYGLAMVGVLLASVLGVKIAFLLLNDIVQGMFAGGEEKEAMLEKIEDLTGENERLRMLLEAYRKQASRSIEDVRSGDVQ